MNIDLNFKLDYPRQSSEIQSRNFPELDPVFPELEILRASAHPQGENMAQKGLMRQETLEVKENRSLF